MARAHELDQAGAPLGRVAAGDEPLDRRIEAAGDLRGREPEIARPHQFALAHRNAAEHLGEIFAEGDADEVLLDLAEQTVGGQPLDIGGKLADRLHVSGKPGEPVRRALLAVEQARHRMALDEHALAHACRGVGQEGVGGRNSLAAELDEVTFGGAGGGDGHRFSCIQKVTTGRHYVCTAPKESAMKFADIRGVRPHPHTKLLQN